MSTRLQPWSALSLAAHCPQHTARVRTLTPASSGDRLRSSASSTTGWEPSENRHRIQETLVCEAGTQGSHPHATPRGRPCSPREQQEAGRASRVSSPANFTDFIICVAIGMPLPPHSAFHLQNGQKLPPGEETQLGGAKGTAVRLCTDAATSPASGLPGNQDSVHASQPPSRKPHQTLGTWRVRAARTTQTHHSPWLTCAPCGFHSNEHIRKNETARLSLPGEPSLGHPHCPLDARGSPQGRPGSFQAPQVLEGPSEKRND